jgi:hypothetical protein
VCVCKYKKKREKANDVYFEKKKKIEIESCSFTILCTRRERERKFIDLVDDNRLFFFFALSVFYIEKQRVDIIKSHEK